MAIITTYKCDKCGKTWDSTDKSEQICTLKLQISLDNTVTNNYNSVSYEAQWCRSCVMSTGIRTPRTEEDKKLAPNKELTTTEKITDFISELGFVHLDD